MKKALKSVYVSIWLACLVSLQLGCALMTREQQQEEEKRNQVFSQVDHIQKANADTASRITELEGDVRSLNGKIEVLENILELAKQDKEKTALVTPEQFSVQSRKIEALEEEVQKLNTTIQDLVGQIEQLREKKTQSSNVSSDGKKKSALDLAEENFEAKEWKQAILHYQKYRETSPKGKKFSEATYRIGVSFQELGLNDEAKTFYDEVIEKFPSSNDAKKSQIRLKSLKKK